MPKCNCSSVAKPPSSLTTSTWRRNWSGGSASTTARSWRTNSSLPRAAVLGPREFQCDESQDMPPPVAVAADRAIQFLGRTMQMD